MLVFGPPNPIGVSFGIIMSFHFWLPLFSLFLCFVHATINSALSAVQGGLLLLFWDFQFTHHLEVVG